MLVSPELLRAFASEAGSASALIRSVDLGRTATTAADGMHGSSTQWAMRLVGEHLTGQANAIGKNVTDMGIAVRGAGDKYEVEDNTLAGAFDGMF